MIKQPPKLPFYSPGIQSLIPLFYVAWSDKVLSPSEAGFLRRRVEELGILDEEEKEVLKKWSDPSRPPSRELFKHWEIELHKAANQLPAASRKSLVDLGLQMARQSVRQRGGETIEWSSEKTRAALEELEEKLGLVKEETYHSIFQDVGLKELREVEEKKATFDIEAMTAFLNGDDAGLRRRVQTLLKDPIFAYRNLRIKEEYRDLVLGWCHSLARQGFGALAFPEAYGGQDDVGGYMTVFETLGYHDHSLTIKFGVQFGLFGGSVFWLGTERHHERYLEPIGALDLPGCFAMTETGHGSNVRGLETTATFDRETGEFVIHSPSYESGKEYIGNALHGHMATVFAQLIVDGENHGVHALLVPLRDESGRCLPGIRIEDNGYKMGLNGVDNGRIWFDEVRIPRENLLNRFGDVDEQGVYSSPIEDASKRFFTMLGTLVGGRVSVPRAGLSAAKSGITIAVKWALQRRQFGPSYSAPETLLLDYPSHQRRLMPLLAKAYALHFALWGLTKFYLSRNDDNIREVETLAAGLKAYSTWFTTEALQECREACGGKGYLSENRFDKLKADTDIFTTFEGDNTVLMQLVAKGVMTKFRQSFSEEGVLGILRYIGSNLATTIKERNPIIIRRTDREHLLDRDFHESAFEYRQERLLYSVSMRMRNMIRDDVDAYQAYLRCQTHMLALADAFVERYVLKKFCEAVDACEGKDIHPCLEKVCRLFALHTLEKHKGWFLEQGYMEGNKTKAIRNLVDELCGDLRHDALALVESFAIPDELLGAEIVT
jgi:acyl-CoA oxidase